MQVDETLIRNVVEQVLSQVGNNGAAKSNAAPSNAPAPSASNSGGGTYAGRFGLFTDANEAARAAQAVLEAVSAGSITPLEGATIMGLVESYRRTLETSELEQRIATLETTSERS